MIAGNIVSLQKELTDISDDAEKEEWSTASALSVKSLTINSFRYSQPVKKKKKKRNRDFTARR